MRIDNKPGVPAHKHTPYSHAEPGLFSQLKTFFRIRPWSAENKKLSCRICGCVLSPPKFLAWYNHVTRAIWIPLCLYLPFYGEYLYPKEFLDPGPDVYIRPVDIVVTLSIFLVFRRIIPTILAWFVGRAGLWEKEYYAPMTKDAYFESFSKRVTRNRIITVIIAGLLIILFGEVVGI